MTQPTTEQLKAILRQLVEMEDAGYWCCDFEIRDGQIIHRSSCLWLKARALVRLI